jgi:hypothetical protein
MVHSTFKTETSARCIVGILRENQKHVGVVSVQNVTIWPIGTSLANFRPAKVGVSQRD